MPNFRRQRPRLLAVLAVLALCTVATGCSDVRAAERAGGAWAADELVVLATFTVLADMAGVVAGPDATVESITGVGMEIHGYEPTPDDLRRASRADLLLANGLGLEAWLEDLVRPLDIPTVVLTEEVEALAIASDGADHAGAPLNPHAWMSPRVGAQYVQAIAAALTALDPTHAADYGRRADAYVQELLGLQEILVERLAAVPEEHRFLVTCEGAFSYLARDAGLREGYLWPVNAERQGTPQQVAGVIVAVREAQVPAVFCESTVSATPQEQVARETGARFGGVLFVDSLSEPDGPVPTYLDLLRHDVEVIVAGLAADA